jgi:RNA polymerase sigma factor (sigma-70 family)
MPHDTALVGLPPRERNTLMPATSSVTPAAAPAPADEGRAERALAERAQRGDHAAYAQLVRVHQGRIFRHLQNLTGSRDEAQELTQDVFLKAWEALPSWQPEARFHTWLYRIASNVAYDLLRRRQVVAFEELPEDHDTADATAGPEVRMHSKQTIALLDAALARLAPDQREIVLLREVEGLSYDELAAALAIDVGTVKSRLARGRAALADIYTRMQT